MVAVAPTGAAFLVALVLTGWTGVLLLLTPAFVLLVLPPLPEPFKTRARIVYRSITRFVQWMWMGLVALLIEKLFHVHVRVWGDAATKHHEAAIASGNDRALWFANHRTRIDWMLLWSVLLRTQTLSRIRIVLKAPLRAIPIFGWAMQHFVFLFLHRKWDDDRASLATLLPFLAASEPSTSYLLFPEGTDLSATNVVKSAAFAAKTQRPARQFSLYPRTTGWCFMFPLLRQELDAVYDTTLFFQDYEANERPSEASLLSGRMPRTLHVYIERIPVTDVPGTGANQEEELAKWMDDRFTRKEALLAAFYDSATRGALPANAAPLFASLRDEQATRHRMVMIAAFWLMWLVLSLKLALALGVYGIVGGVLVAVVYVLATAYTRGVDGVQLAHAAAVHSE